MMPQPSDGFVDVPEPRGEGDSLQGEDAMAGEHDKFHALMEQNMGQIAQSGAIAQNNFITISKAQDYAHLAGGVTLEESLGAREVASRESMAGKPTA